MDAEGWQRLSVSEDEGEHLASVWLRLAKGLSEWAEAKITTPIEEWNVD